MLSFVAAAIADLAAREASRRMSVSQMRITTQPARLSSPRCRRSRRLFASIFAVQYCAFQPTRSLSRKVAQRRPCQKSPSQKTQTFARLNTKSGRPGRVATRRAGRSPALRNSCHSSASARPPFEVFLALRREWAADWARSPLNDADLGRRRCDFKRQQPHCATVGRRFSAKRESIAARPQCW